MEFGGDSYAEILSAIVVFFTPVLTDFGMKVSPDMVGLWLWPLLALYILRLAKGASPRLWLAVGAIAGICLQSKYSVLFFATGLILGLLLTPQRRALFSYLFLLGRAPAVLMALPAFFWQVHYGFPMLEILHNTQRGKNVMFGPGSYLLQQALITGLLSFVWIIGLVWLLTKPAYRFLGYAYLILIGIMITLHGKSYYPANAYPCLIVAGSVAIENCTRASRLVRIAVATAVLALGLATAPLVMPVLPEAQLARYQDRFFSLHSTGKHRHRAPAPARVARRFRRHAWMARTGGNSRPRVSILIAGRTSASRHPGTELRRSRSNRIPWPICPLPRDAVTISTFFGDLAATAATY